MSIKVQLVSMWTYGNVLLDRQIHGIVGSSESSQYMQLFSLMDPKLGDPSRTTSYKGGKLQYS